MPRILLAALAFTALLTGAKAHADRVATILSTPQVHPPHASAIAGLESITIDGTRFWFAFDFGSDLVLTDLFASAEDIAEFAAVNLSDRAGQHPADYWLRLARIAEDDSFLVSDMSDRDFDSQTIDRFARTIFGMIAENEPPVDRAFTPLPRHLSYLRGRCHGLAGSGARTGRRLRVPLPRPGGMVAGPMGVGVPCR